MMAKIGVVDTTFARVDMAAFALGELEKHPGVAIGRSTVPGIKDLAAECKRLLDGGCDLCIALGMVGGADIDMQCAHEASMGIQMAKIASGKHIIEAFVFEREAASESELADICRDRAAKHAANAVVLATNPQGLSENAGRGIRQGSGHAGTASHAGDEITLDIVCCQFNEGITGPMLQEAKAHCAKIGARAGRVMTAPGAFDAPLAAKTLLELRKSDAVVVLGAIVKGGTDHDRIIAASCANALASLALEHNKPVALGIIGPNATYAAALERSKEYAARAVDAAVAQVREVRRIRAESRWER